MIENSSHIAESRLRLKRLGESMVLLCHSRILRCSMYIVDVMMMYM